MARSLAELDLVASDYQRDVLSGARVVGALERLAVERHVRDLADGDARGLRFVASGGREFADRGLAAAWWIESNCRISKGKRAGDPLVLEPWQVWLVAVLFGWERRVAGGEAWLRRFRKAYVSMARKNGKTELVAAIGLMFLYPAYGGEQGGEVYVAATKRDQASYCWQAAAKMARKSPSLSRDIVIREAVYNLSRPESESKFEAVASDSSTLDGLGPLLTIIDEYHEHPTSAVMDVLESGSVAREEPLTLVITTAGGKRSGPCWELEVTAVKALEARSTEDYDADDLFGFICRLDEGDHHFDESVWPKANPNLDVSTKLSNLQGEAAKAKREPRKLYEFIRKHCNVWTETSTAWVPLDVWDSCGEEVDLRPKTGRRAWVGLDLSRTSDYTAAVALLEPGEDGRWDVLPAFWIPQERLAEREQSDRVPVRRWIDAGLVNVSSSAVVDYGDVKQWLLNLRENYEVVEVPTDPANATMLILDLEALGFRAFQMRQGWVTMNDPIKQTERWLRQGLLRHGGNPVLRWMAGNVAIQPHSKDNISLDKTRSGDRIDGIVSLCMAVGRAMLTQGRSVYETRGAYELG